MNETQELELFMNCFSHRELARIYLVSLKERDRLVEELKQCKADRDAAIAGQESLQKAWESEKKEAIKQFAKKVKEIKVKVALPLLGLSSKREIEDYANDILMQMSVGINKLLKELDGE